MVSINLSQSGEQRKHEQTRGTFDKRFVVSVSILILVFGVLFGLRAYGDYLDNQITMVDGQTREITAQFSGESVTRISDFQKRLDIIAEKLKDSQKNAQGSFGIVESLMIPGITLTSYSYNAEEKSLVLKAITDDFQKIAQQVMSFKSNSSVTNTFVKNAKRGTDGLIGFELSVGL